MSLTNLQASILAVISQTLSLLVGFAVINSTQAGAITAICMAVVNAAFLLANSIEQHGKNRTSTTA